MPASDMYSIQSRVWADQSMAENIGRICAVRYRHAPQDQYVWSGRIVGLALCGKECVYLVDHPSCDAPQVVSRDEATIG